MSKAAQFRCQLPSDGNGDVVESGARSPDAFLEAVAKLGSVVNRLAVNGIASEATRRVGDLRLAERHEQVGRHVWREECEMPVAYDDVEQIRLRGRIVDTTTHILSAAIVAHFWARGYRGGRRGVGATGSADMVSEVRAACAGRGAGALGGSWRLMLTSAHDDSVRSTRVEWWRRRPEPDAVLVALNVRLSVGNPRGFFESGEN